jgi:CheY-like chemotaxis protein
MAKATSAKEPPGKPCGTILVAEDNGEDAALLERALRKAGFNGGIALTRDGEETLRYLETATASGSDPLNPVPDLLILDLTMPRMDGLEVLRRLKDNPRWTGIPAVILSGFNELPQVRKAYELGAKTFFLKPLQVHDLEELMSRFFRILIP